MWILTSKKNGEVFYILPEKEKYIVGRSNADLIIKEDNSISRNHAWLYPAEDHVTVVDVGSKYGTFCNQNIENKVNISKNTQVELKNGERVQFGQLGSEWVLSKLNICTMVSSLSPEERANLQKDIDSLNGKIVDIWNESCTHLTMSEITVTVKVLYALVNNIPVVSMDYWKAYLKEIRAGNRPPNAKDFLPNLKESFLNKETVSFASNELRKSVFSGKTFLFMSKRHYNMYEPIISRAGGECKDLNNGVQKSVLIKKNVIVVQHNSSSLSQSSQTVSTITDYIKRNGRRLIPDCEIGLAIIHYSTEKYCNPEYNISADLLPDTPLSVTCKTIIAPRTQVDDVIAPRSQIDKIIAPRTQLEDDSNNIRILSMEIPESVPIQQEKEESPNTLDLFGDDVVESSARPSGLHKVKDTGALKRKRQKSAEPPQKKLHVAEVEEAMSVEYRSPARNEQAEASVAIPETDQEQRKSIERVEKQLSHIDLSGFIDKNTISKMRKNVEPEDSLLEEEEARNKRQRFTFSSDENSNDEIMVSWNVPKKAKIDSARNMLKSASEYDKDENNKKASGAKRSIFKPPEKLSVQKEKQNKLPKSNDTVQKPKQCIVFPSKFNSTGWLCATTIKKEDNSDNADAEEQQDKTKCEWIDSIKEAFEVRIKQMNLTTRSFNETCDENNPQHNRTGKNFKAFVKKRNYKPQSLVIGTEPFVVMSV